MKEPRGWSGEVIMFLKIHFHLHGFAKLSRVGAAVWLLVVVVASFTSNMSEGYEQLVPSIPASQGDSSLAYLWRHALRKQKGADVESAATTFLAPNPVEVINWVPQDSAHPLYLSKYLPLLREILRDYMVAEEVKPDDPRMSQPDGLTVTNLNGKRLTFKKTGTGLTVEGVPVEGSNVNKDGTVSHVLQKSLFGHREKVNQAWEESKDIGGFEGAHGDPPPPPRM